MTFTFLSSVLEVHPPPECRVLSINMHEHGPFWYLNRVFRHIKPDSQLNHACHDVCQFDPKIDVVLLRHRKQ